MLFLMATGIAQLLPSQVDRGHCQYSMACFIIVHGQEGSVEGAFFSHCLFTLEHSQKGYLESAVLGHSLWSDFLFLVCCERYVCKCLGWHAE